MRKENLFGMPRSDSVDFLSRAPCVYVATTTTEGNPVFRAMNAAVAGGKLMFHGSPVGEKTLALGREAVVSAVDVVASIPSYFVDPERACPATTLYRSVQVDGVLEEVSDLREKAAALRALLGKHQPEGGFVPIEHDHPLYTKVIASLLVFGVSLERTVGKAKLGQNRTPTERARMVERMWERGAPTDPRAIELVLEACPDTPIPGFLRSPEGTRLSVAPTERDADAVAALLEGTYWNDRFSGLELASAHRSSCAWVVGKDVEGRAIASARALSDGSKRAWIYDVIVAEDHRGKGVGEAVMRVLLDHPSVRHAKLVHLGTRDAETFYARMGFQPVASLPPRPYRTIEMALVR